MLTLVAFNKETRTISLKDKQKRFNEKFKRLVWVYKDGTIKIETENKTVHRCRTLVPAETLQPLGVKQRRQIKLWDVKNTKLFTAKDVAEELNVHKDTLRRWSDPKVKRHGYIRIGYFKNKLLYAKIRDF